MFQIGQLLEYPTIYFVDGLESGGGHPLDKKLLAVLKHENAFAVFLNLLAKFFHIAFEDANGLGQRHDFSDYPY